MGALGGLGLRLLGTGSSVEAASLAGAGPQATVSSAVAGLGNPVPLATGRAAAGLSAQAPPAQACVLKHIYHTACSLLQSIRIHQV